MTLDEIREQLTLGMRQFMYLEEAEDGGFALRYATGTRNHDLVTEGMRSVGAHFHGGKGPEQYQPDRLTNYWDDTQADFRCFAFERFIAFVDTDDVDWDEIYKKLKEYNSSEQDGNA